MKDVTQRPIRPAPVGPPGPPGLPGLPVRTLSHKSPLYLIT